MELYALDSEFNLITVGIPYSNLQWDRRYYEAGEFMVELPMNVYDQSWMYLGTKDRPELGMIQKIQLFGEGDVNVLLSGFFCEKMLDDKAIYPEFMSTNYGTTSSGGIYLIKGVENIARHVFSEYKDDLPISLGVDNNIGDDSDAVLKTVDDQLGEKLFAFLERHQCSYRVRYDYVESKLLFEVWQGLDRTQSQSENPFQTFSSEFANIVDKSIDIDDSAYKNYAIIPVNADDNGRQRDVYYIDRSDGGYKKEIVFDMRSSQPEEGQSMADFKKEVLQEASERLSTYEKVEEVDIVQAGNVGYMLDYDLGDKCDVILSDIGIKMETRIVEVNEVFKAEGGHEVTIGLGNKRIDNIRRAVSSI